MWENLNQNIKYNKDKINNINCNEIPVLYDINPIIKQKVKNSINEVNKTLITQERNINFWNLANWSLSRTSKKNKIEAKNRWLSYEEPENWIFKINSYNYTTNIKIEQDSISWNYIWVIWTGTNSFQITNNYFKKKEYIAPKNIIDKQSKKLWKKFTRWREEIEWIINVEDNVIYTTIAISNFCNKLQSKTKEMKNWKFVNKYNNIKREPSSKWKKPINFWQIRSIFTNTTVPIDSENITQLTNNIINYLNGENK